MRFRNSLLFVFVFFLSLTLFAWLEADQTFSDPDSFYHARVIKMISEQGVITDFPWQTQTILKDHFTDHHLLYHLILAPLTWFFSSVMAVKIGSVFLNAFFVTTLYWYLTKKKVKHAWAFILLLLTIGPLIVRLSLAKATPLALILLLLGIYFWEEKKYLYLFLISFLYVWAHGGFLILLIAAVIFAVISLAVETCHGMSLRHVLIIIAGFAAGIIINPYFPDNLLFYWQQVIQIGLINYKDTIEVGAEWYAYSLPDLVGATSLMWILALFAVLIFFIFIRKQDARHIGWLILSIFFFLATLRSRRFAEYFIPVMFIFCSLTISWFLSTAHWQKFKNEARTWYKKSKWAYNILFVYLLLVISFSIGRTLYSIKQELESGFPVNTFLGASDFLKQNTEAGAIVFHASWDDWPILFYHNQRNYYLVGLDATFMYNHDREKYNLWKKISQGGVKENLGETIKKNFNSRYVFIEKKEKETKLFQAYLERDQSVKTIYSDEEAKVYEII